MLIVITLGHRNVLEMTQDFDTITEFPLHVEEQGEGKVKRDTLYMARII